MARVLIVDDEFLIARYTELALTGIGHSVVGIAMDSNEAILAAKRQRPDLLIVDIVLPQGLDGFGTVRAIRDMYDVPVLFLSGNLDKAARQKVQDCGRAIYLHKPCDELELQRAVDEALSL